MENNILIAEFMGAKVSPYPGEREYELYGIIECIEDGEDEQHFFTGADMEFHESWDWLMSVVEKIDLILPDDNLVTITFNRCLIEYFEKDITIEGLGNTRLEATFNAVVEFINWYNNDLK